MSLLPWNFQQNKHKQTQKSEYTERVFTCSKPRIKAESKVCKLPKLTKKGHQSDLTDIGTLRNIDITLISLLLTL